jgi:hypothetical protein
MTRSDAWTDDEIVLAIAACPREKQSYSPRHKNVIELADLIGRTPAAVSHHFANISHLIFGGSHGEPHVGARTRELFLEYKGRDGELQSRAAEIRRRLMGEDFTPRAENEISKAETKQLTLDLFQALAEFRIPEGSVQTYEREGSWHFGVLVGLAKALQPEPSAVTSFLKWVQSRLGKGAVESKGFILGLAGMWQEISDGIVSTHAPQLHPSELEPRDRITLALLLSELGTMRRWKPNKRHMELLVSMDRTAERARVGEYLNINATHLCDHCLLLLQDLVGKLLRHRGRTSTERDV